MFPAVKIKIREWVEEQRVPLPSLNLPTTHLLLPVNSFPEPTVLTKQQGVDRFGKEKEVGRRQFILFPKSEGAATKNSLTASPSVPLPSSPAFWKSPVSPTIFTAPVPQVKIGESCPSPAPRQDCGPNRGRHAVQLPVIV